MSVKNSNSYIRTIVVMFIVAVAGSVMLEYLRSDKDNTTLIVQIFVLAGIIVTGIQSRETARLAAEAAVEAQRAAVIAEETKEQTKETHRLFNGEFEQWKEKFLQLEFAKGKEKGAELADARTDKLAEQKDVPLQE